MGTVSMRQARREYARMVRLGELSTRGASFRKWARQRFATPINAIGKLAKVVGGGK